MLNAAELKNFLEQANAAVDLIEDTRVLVSDTDVTLFTRDILISEGKTILMGVLPSYGLAYRDVDNYRHNNKLLLFIVKKFDLKEGYEAFLDIYTQTAPVVLKFEAWLFKKSREFPREPFFKAIQFSTFSADPVRDYHGFFGYMIQFDLNNET